MKPGKGQPVCPSCGCPLAKPPPSLAYRVVTAVTAWLVILAIPLLITVGVLCGVKAALLVFAGWFVVVAAGGLTIAALTPKPGA